MVTRRTLIAASTMLLPLRARAQKRDVLRIGVLTDLSGPYKESAGPGSIACARLAAQDFAPGAPFAVEIISADHHNDPAQGAAIATRWFDHEGVDVIVDVPNSEVALAVAAAAREKNKLFIGSGAGTPDLTGRACSPNTIHWSYDTFMLSRSTGGAFTQAGGSTWFFVTAGYAFGRELEADTTRTIIAAGGRIEGSAAYRFPGTTDFTPILEQARQSGAAVLGLANGGADAAACVARAHVMRLTEQMRIACLLLQLPDVHAIGLEAAGGLLLTESFYWDLNERTRAFTQRLMAAPAAPPCYPGMVQAGCYGGTLHVLKAFAAMGLANARSDGAAVVAHMKATPTDDDAFGSGNVRADGRALFPAYLFRVKTPEESAGAWDYYGHVSTTAAEDAARPLADGGCPLVRT